MSGWVLKVEVPLEAASLFEAALETLGGALALDEKIASAGLQVYLDAAPDRSQVTALLAAAAAAAGLESPAFGCEPLPEVDWVAESHKSLPPVCAGRFYVYGSHVTAPPPAGRIPILIDAATAFGTGRHESTRGCLIALGTLAKSRKVRRALDMGCGSGLLAIAMARLWRCPVMAVDNDRQAVAVTRENAKINGVAPWVRAHLGDGYLGSDLARCGPFDLIAANILAGPLAAMAPALARHLAPGGTAILSGLLASQERAVLAAHRAQCLHLATRVELGEWTTLVLRRRNLAGSYAHSA